MAALICPECFERWPDGKRYQWCPRCEVQTLRSKEDDPIPAQEAEQLLNSYDRFRRWLAQHPDLRFPVLDLSRYDLVSSTAARELSEIPTLEEAA